MAFASMVSMRGSHPYGGRPTLPYSCVLPRVRGALSSSCGAYCPAIRLVSSGGAFSFLVLSACEKFLRVFASQRHSTLLRGVA